MVVGKQNECVVGVGGWVLESYASVVECHLPDARLDAWPSPPDKISSNLILPSQLCER